MIRKSLFAVAAVALLPTFAIAAPAAMTTKPATAQRQTVKTIKTKHHVARYQHALTTKTKVMPAKKA